MLDYPTHLVSFVLPARTRLSYKVSIRVVMLFCLMVDLSSRRIIIDCIKSIYRKVNTLFYFKKFRTGPPLFLFYIFKYQGHTEVTLLFFVNEPSAPWHEWGGKLCHPSNQSLNAIRLEPRKLAPISGTAAGDVHCKCHALSLAICFPGDR